MKVIIVSHPTRMRHVRALQDHLPVLATVVNTVSARDGHRDALSLAAVHSERVVIMEDDAIPVQGFCDLAAMWCDARPHDLLSFYLGTSRPYAFQAMIDQRTQIAVERGEASIDLPTLVHGVCYSIPAERVGIVLARMSMMPIKEADYAIGAAWGRGVCYPLESLVQHRDEAPVERHPDGQLRREPRVARRLAGSLMFSS